MDDSKPMTVKAFARVWFQDKLKEGQEPTESMQETVRQMCANGTIPAKRVSSRWFISPKVFDI